MAESMMAHYASNWWSLIIRGLAAIAFGVAAFIWPGQSLILLALIFGAYVFVDGLFAAVSAFSSGLTGGQRVLLALEGVLGLAIGVAAFIAPGTVAVALFFLIAFWAVMTGIFKVISAIRLREVMENEWLLAISGIVSIIFGIAVLAVPSVGVLAVVYFIAIYALLVGVSMIGLGLRVRMMQAPTRPAAA